MCSTASDYLTFCRALLNGGELGGVRLLGPKTLKLMASNHLPGGAYLPELSRSMFSEATLDGVGFGLGFAVTMDPAKTLLPGSAGEYYWGGMASTAFWIDPAEELITDLHDPAGAVEQPIRSGANCAPWSMRRSPTATSDEAGSVTHLRRGTR